MTPTDEQCDAIVASTGLYCVVRQEDVRKVARAAFAAGAASVPSKDEDDALDLLSKIYSLYENGAEVMEDGDPDSVCIGKSVRISYADEDRIIELLNRRRPHDAATGVTK